MKNAKIALALAGVATAGFAATPSSAQDYYGRSGYYQPSQDQRDAYGNGRGQDTRYYDYHRQREYDGYQQQASPQYRQYYQRRAHSYYNGPRDQGNAYPRGYSQQQYSYQGQRCRSGTTGAIIGGVVGALLGREVGRGDRYNRPSTTGAIIGGGGGALAGRAIERSGNDCR